VLEDLNTLRSYAATRHDQDLFDSVNDTLSLYHSDPVHANHYAGMLSRHTSAPEWYQSKYYGYLRSTPQWTGAEAHSPTQNILSPRLEGQPSYEDEQLAAQEDAYRRQQFEQQQTSDLGEYRQHVEEGGLKLKSVVGASGRRRGPNCSSTRRRATTNLCAGPRCSTPTRRWAFWRCTDPAASGAARGTPAACGPDSEAWRAAEQAAGRAGGSWAPPSAGHTPPPGQGRG
jgi:hypothetical protein